jgi:uncharacterized membrane protein (UPF0182 family)
MPETIEWPLRTGTRPHRRKIILFLILVAVVFFSASSFISYWVNILWFGSLGYAGVYWTTLGMEWGIFAVFAIATFAILFGSFTLLRRTHATDLPGTHTIFFAGQPLHLPVEKVLGYAAVGISLVVALATAAAMRAQWPILALYWHAPRHAGAADPVLGLPLGFYLFTLPAWQLVAGWFLTMAVLIAILAALFLLIAGGGRMLTGELSRAVPLPWRGASFALGLLLLAIAFEAYIGRFELLFQHHTIFDGATYTDAHIMLPGMLLVCAALVIGAALAFYGGFSRPRGALLVAAAGPAILCYVVVALAGWYVTTFIVKPNQLDRERPYIADNIAMTRQAYGLDRFEQRHFPAETNVAALDPAANQATLDNIRLWDLQALQATLRQVQEIRTYYDFPDIDIDRYQLNGSPREVMLAVRELNVDRLPESSRNWINDKLIYTHGYGITMNPVNGFTPEGLPTLYLSNMPVESTVPGLSVTRPEIYFGELTNTDVYVDTDQKEFNYPEGQSNNLTSYSGTGGILMGGFMRRALLAYDRGDISKVPFSDDITPQSRLLMRRNIHNRVAAIAPFLTFDPDPYIVVGGNGHLYWILDGFTSSDTYPYSTHAVLGGQELNYMSNSVKAVVDAYDGSVTFYVFDRADPILAAWRGIFPSLFKDESAMPAWLRAHVRYPELLLTLQAELYGLYHMTDPEVFYNREDQWTVATQTGLDASGAQSTQEMEPNFVLMSIPGESSGLEFVEILPFTPINRNNMIGWIAARSDGAHYGTAVAFDFPKTRLVDGPQQIEARIDQNAQLSGQLTLWNQQGSHVRRGTLLVIPCGKALLYAEPIYLQAQNSPMPELRLVVLALQDKLAYGPDFATAAGALFGSGASSLTASSAAPQAAPAAAAAPGAAPTKSTAIDALIGEANQDFSDYQRLTSEGKLSQAGQKLDDLKRVLNQLNQHSK